MWSKLLVVSSLVCLAVTVGLAQAAALLTPLVVDGERFFTLEWQPVDTPGRPGVEGYIRNEFGFPARGIRLLVDSLDAAGAVTAQTIAHVPFGLPPGARSYFRADVVVGAASYRVWVFDWEWIQANGGGDIQ